MQMIGGYQASALIAAAVDHRVFARIERGVDTAEAMARDAGIALRGAQVLLDGLLGLGLVSLSGGRYENSPDASLFLVEGKPASLAEYVRLTHRFMLPWSRLHEAVKTGEPAVTETTDTPENSLWEPLVTAIAPLAFPVAQQVAARLSVAERGPLSMLDVGGGAGVFSAVVLAANRAAESTQIDWAPINRIAQAFVAQSGVADRFHTIDGDFHTKDFGTAQFDIGIFSNIAHGESPADNIATFRKFRTALRPGGTLVISEFVLNDDRTGNPPTLLFHANMMLHSKAGAVWRHADYRDWLTQAGFTNITTEPTPTPSTLIWAS
jgi:SAM-dependent methyltransferase